MDGLVVVRDVEEQPTDVYLHLEDDRGIALKVLTCTHPNP